MVLRKLCSSHAWCWPIHFRVRTLNEGTLRCTRHVSLPPLTFHSGQQRNCSEPMFPPWLFRELLIQCLSSIISFYPLSRIKPKPHASSFCQAPSLQLPNTSQIHTRKFISFLLHMKIQIKMLFFITVSFQGFQLLLEILLLILFCTPPTPRKSS